MFQTILNWLLILNTECHKNVLGDYIVGVQIQPHKNLFLRMFKEGEIYIDGDAVVQVGIARARERETKNILCR